MIPRSVNAFAVPQRQSNYVLTLGDISCIIVSGKCTGRLGVSPITGPAGDLVDVTGLERTLVDIAVRPAYSGGVPMVLEAYRAARKTASATKLRGILEQLDYVYPYHQAIGFYLERAGYSKRDQQLFTDFGIYFNFYLEHGLDNPAFDDTWKVFYSSSLD